MEWPEGALRKHRVALGAELFRHLVVGDNANANSCLFAHNDIKPDRCVACFFGRGSVCYVLKQCPQAVSSGQRYCELHQGDDQSGRLDWTPH